MSFEAKSKKDGSTLVLSFIGEITGADLPTPDLNGVTTLALDLGECRYINSSGARKWLIWTSDIKNKLGKKGVFEFRNVRPVFVRTQRAIRDFIPAGSKIASVYIPYFCEKCQKSFEILAESGKQFGKGISADKFGQEIEVAKCPECRQIMEIDALGESYARFIS